jgi:hypothetical protein
MVVLVLGWSWWVARRRFAGLAATLVVLESRLGMHNRLSAAAAGACEWPEAPDRVDHGIRWAPAQTLVPVLMAAVFLAAAWWVPVTAAARRAIPDEPSAWRTTEAELAELAREDAVDPESLEQTQQQVDELRAQEPEQWFAHASLEATDKKRESHLQAAAGLQRNLRQTEQGLSRMADSAGALSAKTRAGLQDQFRQALEAMRNGAMKPHPNLLNQLREIDPNQLGQIDRQQMERMLRELREAAEALGECCGAADGGDAFRRAGYLDKDVWALQRAPQPFRLCEGLFGPVRQVRVDLDAHVAVERVRLIIHGPQQFCGGRDIRPRQYIENLQRGLAFCGQPPDVLVIQGARRHRLLEDGRVGRQPEHPIHYIVCELTRAERVAADEVDPDALPQFREL